MSLVVKAIIAILIFVIVSAIAEAVCRHLNVDAFWGWLVGVLVAVAYFFGGPEYPRRTV